MRLSKIYNMVMFIDDNKLDILISTGIAKKEMLANEYISFTSAKDALAYLRESINYLNKLPEIIFLDINMPVMNGFEFLSKFDSFPQEVKEKCKIVLLSSSVDPHDLNKANNNPHVVKFISKPMNISNLDELKENLALQAATK